MVINNHITIINQPFWYVPPVYIILYLLMVTWSMAPSAAHPPGRKLHPLWLRPQNVALPWPGAQKGRPGDVPRYGGSMGLGRLEVTGRVFANLKMARICHK